MASHIQQQFNDLVFKAGALSSLSRISKNISTDSKLKKLNEARQKSLNARVNDPNSAPKPQQEGESNEDFMKRVDEFYDQQEASIDKEMASFNRKEAKIREGLDRQVYDISNRTAQDDALAARKELLEKLNIPSD